MNFTVIIPARYASSRLPAKLLKKIHGKPLIQLTYENAINSDASRIIIATDDQRIKTVADSFGALTCMTDKHHNSGTSRISQVLEKLNISDNEVIVNLQGDEPMLSSSVINQVANNLINNSMEVATLYGAIKDKEQYLDPNCVKVVFNKTGRALYFSRSAIPFFREAKEFDLKLCFKHIGIYAYKAKFIKQYLTMKRSNYEQVEKLEQLTILNEGVDIHIEKSCMSTGYGVDTLQDLERVREELR